MLLRILIRLTVVYVQLHQRKLMISLHLIILVHRLATISLCCAAFTLSSHVILRAALVGSGYQDGLVVQVVMVVYPFVVVCVISYDRYNIINHCMMIHASIGDAMIECTEGPLPLGMPNEDGTHQYHHS